MRHIADLQDVITRDGYLGPPGLNAGAHASRAYRLRDHMAEPLTQPDSHAAETDEDRRRPGGEGSGGSGAGLPGGGWGRPPVADALDAVRPVRRPRHHGGAVADADGPSGVP